jgi:hypothetical protein
MVSEESLDLPTLHSEGVAYHQSDKVETPATLIDGDQFPRQFAFPALKPQIVNKKLAGESMNKNPHRLRSALILSILLTLCLNGIALASNNDEIATVVLEPASVTWIPRVQYSSLVLTVSAPGGEVFRQQFDAGANAKFNLFGRNGGKWPDGHYTYELRLAPVISDEARARLAASRESGNSKAVARELQASGQIPSQEVVQTGSFLVAQGAIFTDSATESTNQISRSSKGAPQQTDITIEAPLEDQVIPDDLIVQGSGCFGFDCVNNESFGFDTLRLKENNTRIKFEDTSTSAGYPSNDWSILANDSASGGANKFSIEDTTGAKTPFTITAGAPTDSIFVDSVGKLGLRTATPGLDLHMTTTNTPAIRMEQTNGGGFTAQTWDIGANEANFFIRDLTGGSKLSFRIRPGAPTSSIDIAATGNVGIGTGSPDAKLDVATTPANGITSGLRLIDTTPITPFAIANLYNSAGSGQFSLSTQTAQNVQIAASGTSFFNGGNVGIGTSAPNYKLDVAGSINATSFFLNGAPFNPASSISGGGTQNRLAKWSNNAGALADSVMTESANNIGIGTTNPGAKLDVNGALRAIAGFTSYTPDGLFGAGATPSRINTPGFQSALLFGYEDFASGDYSPRIGFKQTHDAVNAPLITTTNASFGLVRNGSFVFKGGLNNTEQMRIDNTGRVGIGTTTPQSTLQVNGYVQLALTSGAPPAADCDAEAEYGRMKVDATGNKLYICTSTGWKSTALLP